MKKKRVSKKVVKCEELADDDEEGGGNFIKSIDRFGRSKFGKVLGKSAETIGSKVLNVAVSKGIDALGVKKKRAPSEKMQRRGQLIKQLMKEHGMAFGEASKYIKEHNIEY